MFARSSWCRIMGMVTEALQGVEGVVKPKRAKQAYVGGKKGARKPSGLLRDYRAVYGQNAALDKEGGQKVLRKLYEADPEKFLAQLARLETAFAMAKKAVSVGGHTGRKLAEQEARALGPDEGEERVSELIERLLGEWENG